MASFSSVRFCHFFNIITFRLSIYPSITISVSQFSNLPMRSSTIFSAYVLGLLPSLSVAGPPIFSTLDSPFTLRSADLDQWNLVLDFQDFESPEGSSFNASSTNISRDSSGAARFRLTDGNLTTADGSTAAFFRGELAGSNPLPPLPISFGDFKARADDSLVNVTPLFAAETIFTSCGESKLQLFSLLGGELRR